MAKKTDARDNTTVKMGNLKLVSPSSLNPPKVPATIIITI